MSILVRTSRSSRNRFYARLLQKINTQEVVKVMNGQVCGTVSAPLSMDSRTGMMAEKRLIDAVSSPDNGRTRNIGLTTPPLLRRTKQQQAVKGKNVQYVPGIVNLQVLGAGANGAPSAVYLFTDQSRYLFNCGEGTQRLAHEHKTKLARLEQVFVTRNTWSMLGGFPGLALTVQDAGVRELALHGPPYLDNILLSMKRFVVLKNLKVNTIDCSQQGHFEDNVMTVKSVPLYKSYCDGNKPESSTVVSEEMVIAYVCTLKPRAGALNLEKCVELGVPPGPLLGLLKNGVDVTLDNGHVIKSEEVSERTETALTFIFLDIPSVEYLVALENHANTFHDEKQKVSVVFHFGPEHIASNNIYQSFVDKFSTETKHVYLNSGRDTFSGYIAAHRIQYQLNQVHPDVFPLLSESVQCNGQNSSSFSSKLKRVQLSGSNDDSHDSGPHEDALNEQRCTNVMTNFHLRPRKGFDRTLEAKLHPAEYINETQALEEFPVQLTKLRNDLKSVRLSRNSNEYPKITFLGTGSCIPNKTRNVSAILLQPHATSYMLLDCGEGTLGQIKRFFGIAKAAEVIRNLKAIYVSHLHADHHIGLIGLLTERSYLLRDSNLDEAQKKLLLFAPIQISNWLDFYDGCIESIHESYDLIGNAQLLQTPLTLSKVRSDIGIEAIGTCMVRHCPHSFGVSLDLTTRAEDSKPIKITYSGDSMPCADLVSLGRNSTILIHEATMEDDLVEEAKLKMHSTISQAIQQGREMEAEYIVLTHFSQRYAKLPRMPTIGEETGATALRNVAIAFDNMQVTLHDLQHFHLLYPALRALFVEYAEELEQKALKRELKLERKRKLLT